MLKVMLLRIITFIHIMKSINSKGNLENELEWEALKTT